ncbi:TPA: glycosyltransferase family 2 protein [Streptococcus suis]
MISFVVLHYLVTDETIATVKSILDNVKDCYIIIVDNDSPNNSFEDLVAFYSGYNNVFVKKNVENTGYAGGINFGYDYSLSNLNPDFIVAMNNDMELTQKDFSSKVREIYERTNFYVLGPDIYSTSAKRHQNPEKTSLRSLEEVENEINKIKSLKNKQFILTLKSFLKSVSLIDKLYYQIKNLSGKNNSHVSTEIENPMLHGSFYIFSKKFFESRDYALYPKTSFYCEAQILDYEYKRDKLTQIYTPEIVVLHHEDVATNAVIGSLKNKMNMKYDKLLESLSIFKELIEEDMKS